ncbi:D-cysteine desulfhydrase [Pseudomonas aeruginosa]|uniref:D-cysteine desulfhydrase family protein n=1 Tax=Pseudomonas aeruginosa TaxID=287 RepID=UPI0008FAE270|nr:D-cysteine desulfhydrase family protein [Pseudomonas aeruginosa]OPD98445.1 D-cysteine desulfhydrase [Pseudomonas aeruginosa]
MKSSKVQLATWPSPLDPMPRLSASLGLLPTDLWIKRDDLSGLGGGGNKLRKLEYTCAAALEQGAKALVTVGAAQSNHARLTAAAGARLGMEVVLFLNGTPPVDATGNIALDSLLGAKIIWTGDVDGQLLSEKAQDYARSLSKKGKTAAFIPFGGSNATAALGYVDCGSELMAQAPNLCHIVTAVGSGGTMAGLVHALGANRVLGIDTGAVSDPDASVRNLVSALAGKPTNDTLRIRRDQIGTGYGELTKPVKEALQLVARTEGIILDPVYTGRAFAGLMAAVREGTIKPGEQVVFLHSGGLPGFFGHSDARNFSNIDSPS